MSQILRDVTEITRCAAQYRTDHLAPMGLKACHASYLSEICAEPGISQDRLSQRICINKSNIARQVVILEEGGFLTRVPCPADKRIMQLYPTEKTLALQPQLQSLWDSWEEYLTAGLTRDELDTLSVLLSRMRSKAIAWMEDR